jgi:DNA-directed DNA polymerase III PolC
MAAYAHLQVHSHFTLLGATASVDELVARAAADGMAHLALTDSNALYGAVAFGQACQAAGIQAIQGMTVSVAPPKDRIGPAGPAGRLVLLAMDPAGYRSLCRLSSHLQAHSDREKLVLEGLGWPDLEANSESLICLGGGRLGWIERLLRAGVPAAASRYAARLASIFGDRAYLSLELHQPQDEGLARRLVSLGKAQGLKPVAVQPVYCLAPRDRPRLRLLAAIDHNLPVEAVPPDSLPDFGAPRADLHWLSPEELASRFAAFPQALDAIQEIAARCGPALPDGQPIWPDLKLPEGQDPDQALEILAQRGLEECFGPMVPPTASERLGKELAAIARHGYSPLFLVVSDIVRFARQSGIPVNTRGSVANSLAAYCAGITNVDPIEHDLLFQRFLNPARADLPDIDLDFCSRRRDEVLDYVRSTFGREKVALVSTLSTLRARGAVREVAKAYGLDEEQIKHLVSLLPRGWHPDPRRRDRRSVDDVLAALDEPQLKDVVRSAYGLVGQPHHLSVHPGGMVITPGPLTDTLPLQWAPKGFLITQFDHKDVEALGLPKIDLLGIRALTVLAEAERLIRQYHDPGFSLANIPLDDAQTAELLASAQTVGVFQCESQGARRTLRQLQARTVRDLAVANAFFKPGPATGGMAQSFIRRYRGEEPVAYLHPALAPILGHTKGVLLFQEQVLRVAREIAGLSWRQADQLRRGMSHFGHLEMAEMQAQFVHGCLRPPPKGPGLTEQQAETLWEQIHAFAGYGFNQGHATSYAMVSYHSAYLKVHWPAAFMCARLANWGGFHHPAVYAAEARQMGLSVRPPHVNHSNRRFTLEWDGALGVLWMGLGQVRDLRGSCVRSIIAERRRAPFTNLRDLMRRVPLQHKEIVHLIQCGALDGLGDSRNAMLAEAKDVLQAGSALQMAFSFGRPQIERESPAQRLAWEKHLLGRPVSVHPIKVEVDALSAHLSLHQLDDHPGKRVTVAGVRLPGWTGGRGFYLDDGERYIVAKTGPSHRSPPAWQPVLVNGRWLGDEWGMFRLHVDGIKEI